MARLPGLRPPPHVTVRAAGLGVSRGWGHSAWLLRCDGDRMREYPRRTSAWRDVWLI